MTVLCPGDAMEQRSLLRLAFKWNGPIYMRIGKTGEPQIYPTPPEIAIGKGSVLNSGKDLCLLSTGNMLPIALETSKILKNSGFESEVVSMHTVKPLDTQLLADLCSRFNLLATIEEHSLIGGLGSFISEWLADESISIRLLRFGTQDRFPHPIGSQKYTRELFGLTPQAIAARILLTIESKKYAYASSHPR